MVILWLFFFSAYWQKMKHYLSMHISLKGILLLVSFPASIKKKKKETHPNLHERELKPWYSVNFLNSLLFHYCVINLALRILLQILFQGQIKHLAFKLLYFCESDGHVTGKQMSCTARSFQWSHIFPKGKYIVFYFKGYTTNSIPNSSNLIK